MAVPRVQVVDFFHGLFANPGKGKEAQCPQVTVATARKNAPWLTELELRTRATPTIRYSGLNKSSSFFGLNTLYPTKGYRCADAPPAQGAQPFGRPSFSAPHDFCVYSTSKTSVRFEQYDMVRHAMRRWLQVAPVCTPETRFYSATRCDGDILVFPSLHLHFQVTLGHGWEFQRCLSWALFAHFWQRVYGVAARAGDGGALVVMLDSHVMPGKASLLSLLRLTRKGGPLPEDFGSRVLIGASESNQYESVREQSNWAEGWLANYDGELRRREAIAWAVSAGFAKQRQGFGGPLLVTMPYSTGIAKAANWLRADHSTGYHPSFPRPISVLYAGESGKGESKGEFVRQVIVQAMRRAGAICPWPRGLRLMSPAQRLDALKHVRCFMCAPHTKGTCARGREREGEVFDETVSATFCVQPPGDTLTRSHLYVSVLSGCLPVIFDHGHRKYGNQTTWWAWRHDATERSGNPWAAESLVSRPLDYADFGFVVEASEANSTEWVHQLYGIAADIPRINRMRAALQRALPLFTYATRTPKRKFARLADGDAFTRLHEAAIRAWRSARIALLASAPATPVVPSPRPRAPEDHAAGADGGAVAAEVQGALPNLDATELPL